jgi:integrase
MATIRKRKNGQFPATIGSKSAPAPLEPCEQEASTPATILYDEALRNLVQAAVRVVALLPRNSEFSGAALINNLSADSVHCGERLSDVHALYIRANPSRRNQLFEPHTERAFGYLTSALGNKRVHDLRRKDARIFVEWLKDKRGMRTASIRRTFNCISAALSTYFQDNELERPNPFKAVKIPNEGRDSKSRLPFSPLELKRLAACCMSEDDDVRWLIALIANTGARMSEVAGLALSDLQPYAPLPHVQFIEQPWRGLKNLGSARSVPLVGVSLWAAKRILEKARPAQTFAFPRYTNGVRCNGNSASATVGKWMRTAGLNHSAHDLRHTLADRLRAVQCPDEVRHAIGGWTTPGVAAKYGQGYGLKVMHEWLLKA